MRQAAIVALTLMIIGVAGTAQAQALQPQGTPRYEVAPRRTIRALRSRQSRPALFSRMIELERRKNAWLAQRFGLR